MARTASGSALGLSKTRLKSPLFGAVLCLDRGVGVGEEGKSRLFLDLRYAAAKLPAELLSVFIDNANFRIGNSVVNLNFLIDNRVLRLKKLSGIDLPLNKITQ